MKQGGSPPTGKWVGSPSGGVAAPEPILLPSPLRRFAMTADRLDHLANKHVLAEWLRFMAELSRAQHAAVCKLGSALITRQNVEVTFAERTPPLAADTHVRNAAWRQALTTILAYMRASSTTAGRTFDPDRLMRESVEAIESMANDFLSTGVDADDAAAALYIAAALQVYFTAAAATLPQADLHLLTERSFCPCCGSTPIAGVITASGRTPGIRYLYCSLCSTAWNHVRAVCITCASSGKLSLKTLEGNSIAVRAETCDDCRTYAKMFYLVEDTKIDPYADDLASLALDMAVAEAGFARNAPNALLLAG